MSMLLPRLGTVRSTRKRIMTTISNQYPLATRIESSPWMPRLTRAMRIFVAALLTAGVTFLALHSDAFRAMEATLATWALSPIAIDQIPAHENVYYVWTQEGALIGVRVTIECTALVIGVPLTFVAAALLGFTRARWGRVLVATAVMWLIVLAINVARLGLIGVATQVWEFDTGFPLSHTFVGSLVGIVGYGAGLAALVLIVGIKRPRRLRRRDNRAGDTMSS
ncbi:hypothetical protein [Microbacterium sp. NPDC089695]|uniref:hypothetical protein n=1 Tax=Microbacterium sp. NPDC089695 TaxID=3364198 RepID=UPI0038084A7A